MAADLHALNEEAHMPEGFAIQHVREAAEIAIWVATLNANGFGEGAVESDGSARCTRVSAAATRRPGGITLGC